MTLPRIADQLHSAPRIIAHICLELRHFLKRSDDTPACDVS